MVTLHNLKSFLPLPLPSPLPSPPLCRQYEVEQCSLDVPGILPTEVGSAEGLASQAGGEVPGQQQTEAMEVCEGQTVADGAGGGTDGASPPTATGERTASERKGSPKVVHRAHAHSGEESVGLCLSVCLSVHLSVCLSV